MRYTTHAYSCQFTVSVNLPDKFRLIFGKPDCLSKPICPPYIPFSLLLPSSHPSLPSVCCCIIITLHLQFCEAKHSPLSSSPSLHFFFLSLSFTLPSLPNDGHKLWQGPCPILVFLEHIILAFFSGFFFPSRSLWSQFMRSVPWLPPPIWNSPKKYKCFKNTFKMKQSNAVTCYFSYSKKYKVHS